MTRYVRFSRDSLVPITAPDADRRVLQGTVDGDTIRASDGNTYPLQRIRLLPPVSPSDFAASRFSMKSSRPATERSCWHSPRK